MRIENGPPYVGKTFIYFRCLEIVHCLLFWEEIKTTKFIYYSGRQMLGFKLQSNVCFYQLNC